MVVFVFVMDWMFFFGVFVYYFISDLFYFSLESFKFFYIDFNWVDVMIDGIFSLGNEKGIDMDCVVIKEVVNCFIKYFLEE